MVQDFRKQHVLIFRRNLRSYNIYYVSFRKTAEIFCLILSSFAIISYVCMKPEPLILGVHQSIAGGLDQALYQARKLGCRAVQIFCSNQRQWRHLPLTAAQIDAFQKAKEITRLTPLIVHGSYLINPAASDVNTLEKSICALMDEYKRCDLLGVDYLVIHPGSHMGQGEAGRGRDVDCSTPPARIPASAL